MSFRKKNGKTDHHYSGFLLIELLVTLMLILGVFGCSMRFLQVIENIHTESVHRIHAVNVASSLLEKIRNDHQITLGTEQVGKFTVTRMVAELPSPVTSTRTLSWVTICVSWHATNGQLHTIWLTTVTGDT